MRENIKKFIDKRIDSKRIIYADRISYERHLQRIQHIDIALDTRIYNGHTTTIEMIQAGVPLVTLKGSHFASRVSSSILKILNYNIPGIFHLSSEKIISSYALFRELAINLQVFEESRVFFRDRIRETNELSYMGYLNMKYTTKKLSISPEKYFSLIKNLNI